VKNPNNSLVWLFYSMYFLEKYEVIKARQLFSRAVKCVTDNLEKLNVWKLWMILEYFYGEEKSLDKLYKESIRVNDSLPVYQLMIKIYKEQHKWKVFMNSVLIGRIFSKSNNDVHVMSQ